MMSSHMYRQPPMFITPTFEWRKPTEEERATCSPATLAHVDGGDLLIYPIKESSL